MRSVLLASKAGLSTSDESIVPILIKLFLESDQITEGTITNYKPLVFLVSKVVTLHLKSDICVLNCLSQNYSVILPHSETDTRWPPCCRRHFQMHFLQRIIWVSYIFSLKYVPSCLTGNKSSLVPITAWSRTGDKPLSEPMMVKQTDAQAHCINRWVCSGFPNIPLTHWGRDKMAANFLTTVSNAFSWMKIYEFRLRFHWFFSQRSN